MKYFKIIFNKYTLLILSTLLRLVLIILAVYYLSSLGGWWVYVIYVIRFAVFVRIISDDTNPSHKIPWLVICLAFPIVGITLYILFSKKFVSYRQLKMNKKTSVYIEPYIKTNRLTDFDERNPYIGQSDCIFKQSKMPLYSSTDTKFFATGEQFFEALKDDLSKAKHFIFMEYFYIRDDKMWSEIFPILQQKVSEGVEVRVMYDDIGSIGKITGRFLKNMRKSGINVVIYNRFIPVISAIHNNRDHRKITVIDGTIGYTGGINIGDEYINHTHPFGYWKDTAVRLEGEGVKNFTIMFLQQFDSQTRKVDDYSKYLDLDYPKFDNAGYVQPFCDGAKPLFQDQVGENAYLNMINQAKRSITITTPYFIVDYQIENALKLAASRGVEVRLVVPHIPDKKIVYLMTKSNYKRLFSYGVKVYTYTPGFIHSKMIMVDDEVVIVGTMNFDYRSLVHHYEDGVWMYGTKCINDIKADMEQLIAQSQQETAETTNSNIFVRLFCSLISVLSPLF